jgi:hypothetical protein
LLNKNKILTYSSYETNKDSPMSIHSRHPLLVILYILEEVKDRSPCPPLPHSRCAFFGFDWVLVPPNQRQGASTNTVHTILPKKMLRSGLGRLGRLPVAMRALSAVIALKISVYVGSFFFLSFFFSSVISFMKFCSP